MCKLSGARIANKENKAYCQTDTCGAESMSFIESRIGSVQMEVERNDIMYTIIKDECRKGWGFVRDYVGNTWFYGTLKECKEFIKQIEEVYADEVIL